ncbi:MAG: radical SAM protein [Desulfobulbaceae bacterium]|nr:radical SAM protein [Desulfobulbaceae bacterium]
MAVIIPLFTPHEGCLHTCIFCNQRHIRPNPEPIGPQQITDTINTWLARLRPQQQQTTQSTQAARTVEVAFYGGSFTALPRQRQENLLHAVQPFLAQGLVQGIRLSTRPDSIDTDTLYMLKRAGVHLIELGVQSCDDAVLARSGRGHSHEDTLRASRLIRKAGLQLGWQLMLGMPGEGFTAIRRKVAACIQERPDCIRIYPLVVLRGSRLAEEWRDGRFRPLSLKKAVLFCAYMKSHFDAHKLPIIRMGLQASSDLKEYLLAGPYYPAFGELVRARMMLKRTRTLLSGYHQKEPCILRIAPQDVSAFVGMKRSNMHRLEELGLSTRFTLKLDARLPRQSLRLDTSLQHFQ